MDYILSLSYGKDSIASIEAVKELGQPLDRIVHAEIWATKDVPAELPPMIEFKEYADNIILKRYGIKVEHISSGITFEELFYKVRTKGKNKGIIYGFPSQGGGFCATELKTRALNSIKNKEDIYYLGIASDELKRIDRYKDKNKIKMPLVEIGWTEQYCYNWCEKNNLLSPIYENTVRGGCWFCINQRIESLRQLRKEYPKYWNLLLKWDDDAPYPFSGGKRTIHDFEKRFELEEQGLVPMNKSYFRWEMLDKTKEELEEIKQNLKEKAPYLK